MKYLRMAVTSLLFVALAIVNGCGQKENQVISKDLTPLSFTINSWIGWAPLYLAEEKGLFGTADLEIIRVEDTGARKATLIAGHVDGYASSVDNFALDSAVGTPGKIIMCFDESYGGDGIVAKNEIASIADLRGKQVAFQKGLPSHFLLLTVLKEAGLHPDDIEQVDMDADKAGAAFASGKLDVAVTWEPWISTAAGMSDAHTLITTADYPGLIVDTMVFREPVLIEKRQAVQDVVNGWFAALDYWAQHPEEGDAIMAKAYGLPVDDFRAMVEGVRFFDLDRNKEYFGANSDGPIYGVFDSASGLWLESNIIGTPSLAREKIDGSFLGG